VVPQFFFQFMTGGPQTEEENYQRITAGPLVVTSLGKGIKGTPIHPLEGSLFRLSANTLFGGVSCVQRALCQSRCQKKQHFIKPRLSDSLPTIVAKTATTTMTSAAPPPPATTTLLILGGPTRHVPPRRLRWGGGARRRRQRLGQRGGAVQVEGGRRQRQCRWRQCDGGGGGNR
jgi:hypothetical protein